VVGLDLRVAEPLTATHHQKMLVIRVGDIETAFVGGVDLAFTRRDAPADTAPVSPLAYRYNKDTVGDPTEPPPQFNDGDWQSGNANPSALGVWEHWPHEQTGVEYSSVPVKLPPWFNEDLPPNVYGDAKQVSSRQIWHDQHLKLTGPIVSTIET